MLSLPHLLPPTLSAPCLISSNLALTEFLLACKFHQRKDLFAGLLLWHSMRGAAFGHYSEMLETGG